MKVAWFFFWYILHQAICKNQIFQFVKDVYRDLDYRCATVVVDSRDTIEYGKIALLVKNEGFMIQVKESRNFMNILQREISGRGCAIFSIVNDIRTVKQIFGNHENSLKLHDWYILDNDAKSNQIFDLGVKFAIDCNVFIANFEQSNVVQLTEIYHLK